MTDHDDATISVLPFMKMAGVGRRATSDWRFPPGSRENTGEVHARAVVMPWREALALVYSTDAFGVSYFLRDAAGRVVDPAPRVTKQGLPWLRGEGFEVRCRVMFADLDGPSLVQIKDRVACDGPLADAAWYATTRGARVVRPLPREVSPEAFEDALAAWYDDLAGVGLHADRSCRDWTHQFRMPHVTRT